MRIRWSIVIAVFVTNFVFGYSVDAEEAEKSALAAVEEKVKETVPAVLDILRKEEMASEEKGDKILDILSPVFRFELMAKLTLGRQYWGQLTEEQQEEFVDLFVKHLQMSYIGKAEHFADKEIHYGDAEWLGSGRRKILMNTYVFINDSKNVIKYKFYKQRDGWKVYDIEIEGVSIIRSYKSQYVDVLEEEDVETLFEKIRSKVDKKKCQLEEDVDAGEVEEEEEEEEDEDEDEDEDDKNE